MDIYILARTPDAAPEETREWTTFCHQRADFVTITHHEFRDRSRWTSEVRKRPFQVRQWRVGGKFGLHEYNVGWYATLEAARKAAAKHVVEIAK